MVIVEDSGNGDGQALPFNCLIVSPELHYFHYFIEFNRSFVNVSVYNRNLIVEIYCMTEMYCLAPGCAVHAKHWIMS